MSKNANAKSTKSSSSDKKKAKKRDNDEDAFTLLGRYTVRAIYPWPKVKKIVALGIEFPAGSRRRKAASLSPEKLSQLAIYDKMYDYSAPFRAMIKKGRSAEITAAIAKISESVSAMRSYDTNQLKKKVLEYAVSTGETIHPPLSSEDKSGRGYWHNQVGRMLTPFGFLARYDTDPALARTEIRQASIAITADLVPLFAYGTKNPLHVLDQLCRGDLISRVYHPPIFEYVSLIFPLDPPTFLDWALLRLG
ncbi:hypothetical protein OF83DRAFT_1089645, partial [Amylostereum chailletii]